MATRKRLLYFVAREVRMSTQDAAAAPHRGLADKHRAILRGALSVFARDGYTRASIDAIAREAGVSTRTIYNHFQDKAQLFRTVIQDSATQVAEAETSIIDRYLSKVTDLEPDLIAFACVWASPRVDYADHFALVRQINAEVGHIPQAALDAWQEAGPMRVRRELACRLQGLAEQGLLRIEDAERTAFHFVTLIAGEVRARTYQGAIPISDAEVTTIATAGVRAFLHGYLP
jgi:AcrR family transcriptional regulator